MEPKDVKKITIEQWTELQNQFDRTPAVHESTVSGEHYNLMHLLNRLGYRPHSREETIEIAEMVLTYGYPN
jgi:hypothetical protein